MFFIACPSRTSFCIGHASINIGSGFDADTPLWEGAAYPIVQHHLNLDFTDLWKLIREGRKDFVRYSLDGQALNNVFKCSRLQLGHVQLIC